MNKLTRNDLYSLEKYAEVRSEFRQKAVLHKRNRQLSLGEHVTIYFEDRLTVQYQVQEMLRVERIFETQGIEEELAAYNPLIPDGSNWKATFMIEYSEVAERQAALSRLINIEDKVWIQVGEHEKVYAIADEDLDRENEQKTSAVHFLRFQLSEAQVHAVQTGTVMHIGIDHSAYQYETVIPDNVRTALMADIH